METCTLDRNLESRGQGSPLLGDPTVGSMIELLEDLPVKDINFSLTTIDTANSQSKHRSSITTASLIDEALQGTSGSKTKEQTPEEIILDPRR
eukprot:CAMPEP_0176472084 /NCGR_PEP_ID=MMETSP0127-20121128/41541_1 /TAXON_ID=938130 /ORGANISM="Platyophrya macrostoma, Strain WH" /LENGTH=92 /DNA_ID=CAMNT_0017866903 /DNA_START=29 /DNA_END=304 /DNA_ORIENTATION=+